MKAFGKKPPKDTYRRNKKTGLYEDVRQKHFRTALLEAADVFNDWHDLKEPDFQKKYGCPEDVFHLSSKFEKWFARQLRLSAGG